MAAGNHNHHNQLYSNGLLHDAQNGCWEMLSPKEVLTEEE
jgi:hypothetical protein